MTEQEALQALIEQVRQTLKTRYPAVRFSVAKFKAGYWGTTYIIRWREGPSETEVQGLIDPLRKGALRFDYVRRQADELERQRDQERKP